MKLNFFAVVRSVVIAALVVFGPVAFAQTGNVGIGTTSPQSQLHTTGGVRHDTLAGIGSRLVYADAQGRMFTPAPLPHTVIVQTGISGDGCISGDGVVSSITVSGQPTSVSSATIRVRVDISHTYASDVRAYLMAPNGQVLRLIYNNGDDAYNFTNTVFWDGAASPLPTSTAAGAPFTGLYKPNGGSGNDCSGNAPTVSTFGALGNNGTINPNGLWTLRVYDTWSADVGSLNNWGISFNGASPPVPVPVVAFKWNAVAKGNGAGALESSEALYEVEGKVGIGTATPHAPLQFANGVASRKIVLHENANDDHQFYGFGVNGGLLRYQADHAGADHVFYSAASATASTELLRIKGNGNVGLGTSAPSYRLHASGSAATTAYFSTTSTDPNGVVVIDIPATNAACILCSSFMEFRKVGATIGSISADLSANVVSYSTTSDKRLKEDITPTRYGLQDLMRIDVKDYRMKGATKRSTGVMAQDLFGIYPEAVQEGDRGEEVENAWAVDYGKLTPLLIKAVQEQQAQIEALQKENGALQKSVDAYAELAKRLTSLEALSAGR